MKRKLPNASHCFVCGLENQYGLQLSFYIAEDRRVESKIVIPDHYQGYPGTVHGGIIATMLDETLARAVMVDDPNRFMFTGRLITRYRKPVPIGESLRLVGEIKKDRGRIAECVSYLYNQDGDLLAEAEGLMVDMPVELDKSPDFEGMSWKVYPDTDDRADF
jgi:acyl-coenzyme A thioesterase PaaI-like protein